MRKKEIIAIDLVAKGIETVVGATEAEENIILRFRVPRRLAVKHINAVLYPDGANEDGFYADTVKRLYPSDSASVADPLGSGGNNTPRITEFSPEWVGYEGGTDIYEAEWYAKLCGLYYLKAEAETAEGRIYAEKQITVYRKGWRVPDWLIDGVMYQIFPDRFFRSEKKKLPVKPHAEINYDWNGGVPKYAPKPGDPLDNNEFFGGSLYGVVEKLDYLVSLGVNIIYLNPIFEAYSNHKYDTADYTYVDEMFGGDEALDELIGECDKRGIRIILDGVFNHTGSDSIYFNAEGRYSSVGAAQDKSSPYYDWFSFKEYPDTYDCWWGVKILPTLNKSSRSLRDFISGEKGVIRRWLKKGISGWRLDVVDEIPDSMVAEITAAANAEREDAIVLGEVWEDASDKIAYGQRRKYFQGYELDSVMNYPFRTAIIDYVMSGNAEGIASVTENQYARYPKQVSLAQMNFLGTHDTERILGMLSGVDISGLENAKLATLYLDDAQKVTAVKRLKLAAALLYALPGVPCIYYGDEVGLEGWRDPFNRRPFPWGRENTEILEFYRVIGGLRRCENDLRRGEFSVISSENGVFVFKRGNITIVANNSSDVTEITSRCNFTDIITDTPAHKNEKGLFAAEILPCSVAYFKNEI